MNAASRRRKQRQVINRWNLRTTRQSGRRFLGHRGRRDRTARQGHTRGDAETQRGWRQKTTHDEAVVRRLHRFHSPASLRSAGTKGVPRVFFPSTAAAACDKNVPGVPSSWAGDTGESYAVDRVAFAVAARLSLFLLTLRGRGWNRRASGWAAFPFGPEAGVGQRERLA